jgi:hypothetical protein
MSHKIIRSKKIKMSAEDEAMVLARDEEILNLAEDVEDIELEIKNPILVENEFRLTWKDGSEELIIGTSIADVYTKSRHKPKEVAHLDCWEIVRLVIKIVDPDVQSEERITSGLGQLDKMLELNANSSLDGQVMQILQWNMDNFGSQLKVYQSGKTTNMSELESFLFKNVTSAQEYITRKGGNDKSTNLGASISVGKRLIRYWKIAQIFM